MLLIGFLFSIYFQSNKVVNSTSLFSSVDFINSPYGPRIPLYDHAKENQDYINNMEELPTIEEIIAFSFVHAYKKPTA